MLNYINWTLDPAIITEPIEIRYYSLFFAIAFYVGNLIIDRIFKAENIDPKWLDKLLIYVIIATIVGARLGHVFFYDWDDYKNNLQEIFMIWHGGLASHGAAVGIILAAWLFSIRVSKKSILWILDRIVLTIALATFLIRLG
ncbi:MAG: prolipoprotein diacylglyceryl transferase, partial [Bacteroidia bacterium]